MIKHTTSKAFIQDQDAMRQLKDILGVKGQKDAEDIAKELYVQKYGENPRHDVLTNIINFGKRHTAWKMFMLFSLGGSTIATGLIHNVGILAGLGALAAATRKGVLPMLTSTLRNATEIYKSNNEIQNNTLKQIRTGIKSSPLLSALVAKPFIAIGTSNNNEDNDTEQYRDALTVNNINNIQKYRQELK